MNLHAAPLRRTATLAVAGLSLLGSGLGIGVAVSAGASAPHHAPAHALDPTPVTVVRQSLAEATAPPGAPKRTLGLSKVTVMPGAQLASHHHPGEQLGYVAEGVLTYTVETRSASVMTGPGDDATLVRKVLPGQTVRVKPGQWLVEQQDEVHHARNAGSVPIVIYIATLLRTGEPAAIPD